MASLRLVAYRNKKGKYFLTNKYNSFGNINVEYVMIDTGCSSLPLKNDQLEEIARWYPKNEYIWELSYCEGNCTLIVKKLAGIMNAYSIV
jgi:hypothetical protein